MENPDVLAHWGQSSDTEILKIVAHNKNTSSNTLGSMDLDKNYELRRLIVSNKNCPIYTLHDAVQNHNSEQDLQAIAQNPHCPEDILEKIIEIRLPFNDHYDYALRAVANNPNCTLNILQKLNETEDPGVHNAITAHHKCSPELIRESMYAGYGQEGAAQNPNCPPDMLEKLALDSQYGIRAFVAQNPSTPMETIINLGRNKDKNITENLLRRPDCPPEVVLSAISNFPKDEEIKTLARNSAGCTPHVLAIMTLSD
jgi:hypothetical protein